MSGMQARVPAGVRTGGRFSSPERLEPELTLHSLDDVQPTVVSPSDEVIDKTLSMSGIALRDGLSDHSPREVRDAFLVGREVEATAPPTRNETHAVARRLHMRSCGACHGADQSCIQIEEQFTAEARLLLKEARQARTSN